MKQDQTQNPESAKSILVKAILSGIVIGIGGIVYLNIDNKYLGSFLFSLGLFTILRYGFSLYTGKVGYIPERSPVYLREVGITLLGNILGTALTAILIRFTKTGITIHENAVTVMTNKTGDSPISQLILGFFCGILMFIAVDNGNRCKKENRDFSFIFGTVLPVMVFILCGFNHSIADCFYFFASIAHPGQIGTGLFYLLLVILGNALGGMSIPVAMKFFDKNSV
ncbi:MAG: formate/nitrite transporter family protein [Oscillospiraceae bacterium]|nr:formate/nitrite transporter family protein [Oscillospiraceae bacterium]